jgi:crotonobetainyl-CoA:carnitine CoA-transferase CaiB-like acyl-CoA transferase
MDAGFHVTTIESGQRPDPTKHHHPEFYADLHSNKHSLTIDFDNPGDFQLLSELLASCDVVVTGSRRRAFDQLGLDVDQVLASSQPSVWVSITGYGYQGPGDSRVGFGDDCAAAGGLVVGGSLNGGTAPAFMGDAIADPLTGVIAAAAVLDWLVDGDFREDFSAELLASSARESCPQQGLHLQISLAECANWVSRGGQVSADRRDWTNEGRL